MNQRLGTAAALGAVTGLRSLIGLTLLSRELSDRRRLPRRAGTLEQWLSDDLVAITLSGLALSEIVADKLPGIPDRVAAAPLFGRGLMGGLVGAVAAGAEYRAAGAALGAAGAVVGAYVGWFLRREAGRATMLPDAFVALVEDAVAITAGRELIRG